MCRYASYTYRDTYVCTSCRESWQGDSAYGFGSLHCPRCGVGGVNVGKDYRVPRKNRVNQWKKLQVLIESNFQFQSCGCRGPGRIPETYAQAKSLKN